MRDFKFIDVFGGGGTTCVATPEELGDVYNVLVEVTCGLGQGFTAFRHVELDSASHVTSLRGAKRRGNPLINRLKNKTHPNPVLDLLHAHRVSPKLLRNRRLNLFAIRTHFIPSVRKSAPLQREGTSTLSRICKFAYRSLTNSTLSQRERVKCGFTLAEVLITLGIIGVVAVLTIAPLIHNYKMMLLENQFKVFNSKLQQSLSLIANEYGVDKFEDIKKQYCGNLEQFSLDEEAQNKCREIMDNEMPRINDMLIEHLGVVSKKTYQLNKDYDLPSASNLWGKFKVTYQYQTAGYAYGWKYGVGEDRGTSIYYLKNGASFNGIVYGHSNHMGLTFDTNGPYKGPNKLGYDIFNWYSTMHSYNQDWCSFVKYIGDGEGVGCYYYAARNVNPDDNTKDYWKDFLR